MPMRFACMLCVPRVFPRLTGKWKMLPALVSISALRLAYMRSAPYQILVYLNPCSVVNLNADQRAPAPFVCTHQVRDVWYSEGHLTSTLASFDEFLNTLQRPQHYFSSAPVPGRCDTSPSRRPAMAQPSKLTTQAGLDLFIL